MTKKTKFPEKVKHRKTIGGYLLDWLFSLGEKEREIEKNRKELKMKEKSRDPSTVECSSCGKIGVIARCSHRPLGIFEKCDKALCKDCAKKTNGKYYCKKHLQYHQN